MNLVKETTVKDNKKVLNKGNIFVLSFGAMIGWSWVVLSGDWVSAAGTLGAIAAFLLGGIVILFISQVYAELTSAFVDGGGVKEFCKRGIGYRFSFIGTWMVILGYMSVIAFEAVALPTVLGYLFGNFFKIRLYDIGGYDVYLTWLIIGIAGSIIIIALNIIGLKTVSSLQTFMTVFIGLLGLTLMGGSVINGDVANTKPLFVDGLKGIITVAAMTPFMYVGFDVIPQAAQEMRIKHGQIGKIMVLSVVTAICWYVMIIVSVSLSVPKSEITASALTTANAMKKAFLGNQLASKVLICGGVAGILTSWNSFYIGASRAMCHMAREGMLPAFLAKEHPRFKTPCNAIILIGIITSLAPFFGRNMLVWLVNAGGLGIMISYLLVSISFLALRRKEPGLNRPYRVKYGNVVGVISVVLCVLLALMYMPFAPAALSWPHEWIIIIGWSLLGMVLYVISKKARA